VRQAVSILCRRLKALRAIKNHKKTLKLIARRAEGKYPYAKIYRIDVEVEIYVGSTKMTSFSIPEKKSS
jgi:hypothetical protein